MEKQAKWEGPQPDAFDWDKELKQILEEGKEVLDRRAGRAPATSHQAWCACKQTQSGWPCRMNCRMIAGWICDVRPAQINCLWVLGCGARGQAWQPSGNPGSKRTNCRGCGKYSGP